MSDADGATATDARPGGGSREGVVPEAGRLPRPDDPDVSVVVPARDEEAQLPGTLRHLREQETGASYEVVVVDGDSDDDTAFLARAYGARVIEQSGSGIGAARDEGAAAARGDVLAFVDADARVRPDYLDEMLALLDDRDLAGATSRCRITGDVRTLFPQFVTNRVFPRSDRPTLPGFNTVVRREAYEAAGGYRNVPNEDKAFSRELARVGETAYHPEVLVEVSGRRIDSDGLVRTILHYLRKDLRAVREPGAGDRLGWPVLAAAALALLAGVLQLYHGVALDHPKAALATTGFLGGVLLFVMDVARRRLFLWGLAFLCVQWGYWLYGGPDHGTAGLVVYGAQLPLAALLAYVYCCYRGYGGGRADAVRTEDAVDGEARGGD